MGGHIFHAINIFTHYLQKKQNNYINLGIGSNEQINPIHCLF